jgi:penicillin-binding protein 1C
MVGVSAKPIALSLLGAMLFFFFLVFMIPLPQRLAYPPSRLIRYEDGQPAHVYLSTDDKWRLPVHVEKVDRRYVNALLSLEDKRFFNHGGVDLLAVLRAVSTNSRTGSVVSGASTITMQLVRIVEQRPRTIWSKVIEALRAVQLEARFSKKQILEFYLQFLPFGGNTEGLESASYALFGHSSEALSHFEISYLLSIPQNPGRYNPSKENEERIRAAVVYVSDRLYANGLLSTAELRQAQETKIPLTKRSFPRNIYHWSDYLSSKYNGEVDIESTIEKPVQDTVERILSIHQEDLRRKNIFNGAVVVIDNFSSEVLSAVGNFDFWDDEHGGQIQGFRIPRSPGSSLKPFIYALGIDGGHIMPSMLVEDIPIRFGGYEPRNYENTYNGLVSIESALVKSLNVPFVNLLQTLGVKRFNEFLSRGGISSLKEESGYYGLSMATGGVEVSLLELTNLYSIFRREGRFKQIRDLKEDYHDPGTSLLSPEASYLTGQAMQIRERPGFMNAALHLQIPDSIMWKTGTSQNHRDAWTIGSNSRYTVGVWLGNFDASPSWFLEGGRTAAPLLFDILRALSTNRNEEIPQPPGLIEIEVCSFSGRIPGPDCPDVKTVLVPQVSVHPESCPYHIAFAIDKETGYHLPPLERRGREWEEQIFLVLPSAVRLWIADKNFIAQEPPKTLPSSQQVNMKAVAPEITVPSHRSIYFLMPSVAAEDQEIPFSANADPSETELSWFVNGKFYGKSKPSERIWFFPELGEHKIRVLDSSGEYDEVVIEIKSVESIGQQTGQGN